MRVSDVAEILQKDCPEGLRETEVSNVTQDSRRVREGSVFVALQGDRLDGHDFVSDAVGSGAAVCVCERSVRKPEGAVHFMVEDTHAALSALAAAFYGHPSKSLTCAGVTGTDGKTSTSSILKEMLDREGGAGLTSTVSYMYGERNIPAERTTPDAVTLQELLHGMASHGLKYAVLEVSSHALIQKRVNDVDFKVGILTNLSPEHLDYHKTIEEYRDAKARLFEVLPSDGYAVLNAEDPVSDHFEKVTKAEVVRYGSGGAIDGRLVEADIGTTTVHIKGLGMDAEVGIALTGRHNVQNVLAACCAASVLGIGSETVIGVLESVSPVRGRLEMVDTDLPCTVLVDYAHTSRALRSVLEELKGLCRGRIILVFGCGGDRDRSKRPRMGKIAEELADIAWITSDNPRSEDPQTIIGEIVAGMERFSEANVEPDREMAIQNALASAKAGDVVLIAGKGHEKFQLIGDTAIPFDDREVARKVAGILSGAAVRT